MPPTAAAAKPSDTPSLYVQGWLSAQDAAVACNYAYIVSVVGGDLGAAFLLYLCIGAIYWGCAAILATCVDVVPKSLAPGAGSGAAYTPIPGGGIRV